MPAIRVDLFLEHHDETVMDRSLAWFNESRRPSLIRHSAYKTVVGWHVKIAVDDEAVAEAFRAEFGAWLYTQDRIVAIMRARRERIGGQS